MSARAKTLQLQVPKFVIVEMLLLKQRI